MIDITEREEHALRAWFEGHGPPRLDTTRGFDWDRWRRTSLKPERPQRTWAIGAMAAAAVIVAVGTLERISPTVPVMRPTFASVNGPAWHGMTLAKLAASMAAASNDPNPHWAAFVDTTMELYSRWSGNVAGDPSKPVIVLVIAGDFANPKWASEPPGVILQGHYVVVVIDPRTGVAGTVGLLPSLPKPMSALGAVHTLRVPQSPNP